MIIYGTIIGILIASIFSGKYEGDKINRSIRIPFGENFLHIHHWIWGIVALFTSLIYLNAPFIAGIFLGICIQGLSYKDAFRIWYKN